MAIELAIREAREDEYDEVGRLTVEAYQATLRDELGEYRDELLDVATRASSATVLVALDRDVLLGTVTYVAGTQSELHEFDDPESASIRMLAVHPRHQGHGVGRSLTEACLARARAAGRRRMLLYSTEPMVVARGMYERMGFRREPSRDWPFEREDGSRFVLLCYVLDLRRDAEPGPGG